jgi:hypothetical protein
MDEPAITDAAIASLSTKADQYPAANSPHMLFTNTSHMLFTGSAACQLQHVTNVLLLTWPNRAMGATKHKPQVFLKPLLLWRMALCCNGPMLLSAHGPSKAPAEQQCPYLQCSKAEDDLAVLILLLNHHEGALHAWPQHLQRLQVT